MKPDPGPPPDPAPDPESLLRSLHFRPLPEAWRDSILAAAATAGEAAAESASGALERRMAKPRPFRPWFRRPLVQGLAAAWMLIAGLRLTTPAFPAPTPGQMLALSRPASIRSMDQPSAFQLVAALADHSSPSLNASFPP